MSPRTYFLFVLALVLSGVGSSACVATLPAEIMPPTAAVATVALEETSETAVESSMESAPVAAPADEGESSATEAISDPTPIPEPTATPEPSPPTPTPILPDYLKEEALRDLALDYLRDGYGLKLPENQKFEPIDPPLEPIGEEIIMASYGSGPWNVLVGEVHFVDDRVHRSIIVSNDNKKIRWWGEIDGVGTLSTTVSGRLPRPKAKKVSEWVGRVVKLPPGSAFDDYVQGANGERHGIESNKAEISAILDNLGDYDGRVKLWGELQYAASDYNARRLIVRKINLMDGPLPALPEPEITAEEPAQSSGETTAQTLAIGPTGIVSNPLPGSILMEQAIVAGEATGVFENNVVIQIETDDGAILGRGFALTDALELGQSGRFAAEIAFDPPASTVGGRVALYGEDPRDGSLILLIWTPVQFAGPTTERNASIQKPAAKSSIRDSVLASGTATGVNDKTVLVRVEDMAGTVWGDARAKTDKAGNWELRLNYRNPPTTRTGRIAVYDVNPEDDSLTLLQATDVELAK